MIPLGDEYRPLRKPYVNYFLIAANTAIFFYFFAQGYAEFIRAIYTYGLIPWYVVNGRRLWTFVTSMFMHGSVDHLLGNMLYLYIFGDNVEDSLGHARYVAFYVLSGIGASLVHIATLPPYRAYWLAPAVGASGAISGVLGAYMLLHPRVRVRVLVPTWFGYAVVRVPAYYFIFLWFLYQLYAGTWALIGVSSGIAFFAHIGGFITGVLLTKVMRWRRPAYRRPHYVGRGVYRVPVE